MSTERFSTMSPKHTNTHKAKEPPPTSWESGGSWIGKRKGDLVTVLLRSEPGREMTWSRRLRKALSRTPSRGGREYLCSTWTSSAGWVFLSSQSTRERSLWPCGLRGEETGSLVKAYWQESQKRNASKTKNTTHPKPCRCTCDLHRQNVKTNCSLCL